MKKYDDIVVGSGISGLTLTLLLAMNGRRVLLVEKHRCPGGALRRFHSQGIPFDTGFHFTSGFRKNGLLHEMLTILGIHHRIKPIYLAEGRKNRLIFESEQAIYEMPPGIPILREKLKGYFPGEHNAIDRYFDMVRKVCERTPSMNLRNLSLSPLRIDEDFISLKDVLSSLTGNRLLKALLAKYSMCYGVKPSEISFANHSRVSFGLYESVARVKDGGEAFIRAILEKFQSLDVDIICGRQIIACADIKNNRVRRFILNGGEDICADRCIFTIHPRKMLEVLPKERLSKAFINRVKAFEPSAGFFSVFGVVKGDGRPGLTDVDEPTILSLFPTTDIERLLDPAHTGARPLVIMKNIEEVNGKSYRVISAFEISFAEHLSVWKDSKTGNRPPDYREYKQQRIESIRERILKVYPEYRDTFKVVDAASMLTFRDYLHSPEGSAYGVKQKLGQYNLFGKMPPGNLYAAGQSSLLPGLVGSMMSSFIVGRSIIGKEKYSRFIRQKLCS